MRICVNFVHPPIPDRNFDYCAYDSDTYDGAPDARWQCVGWGRTERDAVIDYWTQRLER
jgi:hypothetical protein